MVAQRHSFIAPLFVPADRPDRFAKAAASGADAVIVDLEDAVAADRKEIGRQALTTAVGLPISVIVRVNAPETPWHDADIGAVRSLGFDWLILPKVEEPGTVAAVAAKIGPGCAIIALIESARGLSNARAIAAHPSTTQLAFGPADYSLDMGVAVNSESAAFALASLAVASRAEGKWGPLDGPSFDLSPELEGLERELSQGLNLGIAGKLCIHPRQVAPVRNRFRPSAEEVAWAQKILAEAGVDGPQRIDGIFVDRPIRERAAAILARHKQG